VTMSVPILQVALQSERDVVQARQRAREVAAELGLDNQDQIRLATATSEIARNAFRYASNGKVAFSLDLEQQRIEVEVTDAGGGIPNLDEVLEGRYRSMTGMGMGIIGTKRLMDDFEIDTSRSGTTVRMGKLLPRYRNNWVLGWSRRRCRCRCWSSTAANVCRWRIDLRTRLALMRYYLVLDATGLRP